MTKLDDTKSYYQLIIKISISEKARVAKLWKKGKICIKINTYKGDVNILRPPLILPAIQWALKTQEQAEARTRTHLTTTLNVIDWFKLHLWVWLVEPKPIVELQHFRHPTDEQLLQLDIYRSCTPDLGLYSLNWLIELSDNKLSNKRLANELVKNRSFSNLLQSRKL